MAGCGKSGESAGTRVSRRSCRSPNGLHTLKTQSKPLQNTERACESSCFGTVPPVSVISCHPLSSGVIRCHFLSSGAVTCCHSVSSGVICCHHSVSFRVICCHPLPFAVIHCHLVSSAVILSCSPGARPHKSTPSGSPKPLRMGRQNHSCGTGDAE